MRAFEGVISRMVSFGIGSVLGLQDGETGHCTEFSLGVGNLVFRVICIN